MGDIPLSVSTILSCASKEWKSNVHDQNLDLWIDHSPMYILSDLFVFLFFLSTYFLIDYGLDSHYNITLLWILMR